MRPTSLQLEVTYACNNNCGFCYNNWATQEETSISFERLKEVIIDAKNFGIFSININGGEPLLYPRFFDLAEFIVDIGLDIHCNTNVTLVDDKTAKRISKFFKAVCTSIHGATSEKHDYIVGREGAFSQTISGIKYLQKYGVYVATNITLSKKNITFLDEILCKLREIKVQTVLLTRVLTQDNDYALSDIDFISAIEVLKKYTEKEKCFSRIALPQPFPVCKCTNDSLKDFVLSHNIPCAAGILTARISPSGIVTPCPVLNTPVLGNVNHDFFSTIWERFEQTNWHKKTPFKSCNCCSYLPGCGGGCLRQEDSGVLI